ncbi:MAG: hypothetical protein AAFN07_10310 [Pseudomonadota bacterium]
MNDQIGRFQYHRVQFKKDGTIHDDNEVNELLKRIKEEAWDKSVFIAHGWNNNSAEADTLFTNLFENADTLLNGRSYGKLDDQKIGVIGLFWPSKKFTSKELKPSGEATVDDTGYGQLVSEINAIVEFSAREDAVELGARAESLVRTMQGSETQQDEFVATIRDLLSDGTDQGELTQDFELNGDQSGSEILEALGDIELPDEENEFVGGAAGLGDVAGGIGRGATRFLNTLTYFTMKKRAGTVGVRGGAELIKRVHEANNKLSIDVVGHSFGGRLVSAIAKAHADGGLDLIDTATLLQAAFSHYGFASGFRKGRDGFFRPVIEAVSVKRRIIVSFSENDKAVGRAYPLASRVNREDAAGLGDATDRFGGIGHNGAQKTPEATFDLMLDCDKDYQFKESKILNFDGKTHICDHSDVVNKHVANLLLQTIAY